MTLEAATMDADAGASLRAGRLSRALEPPSDFGLADMPEPTGAASGGAGETPTQTAWRTMM